MKKSYLIISLLVAILIFGIYTINKKNLDIETNILLKLTGAKSLEVLATERTQEMHEVMQYFEVYKDCEKDFAKKSYLYRKKEVFLNDPKTAQSLWNSYIDNEFRDQVNEKLKTLTKENLKDRYNSCNIKELQISKKVNEFEKQNIKSNPKLRLNLDYNRDQK